MYFNINIHELWYRTRGERQEALFTLLMREYENTYKVREYENANPYAKSYLASPTRIAASSKSTTRLLR